MSGAACALMAGMLMGSAMQPHLYDGDRPSGPQMFAEVAGARSTGPFDPGTSVVSYQGRMPDYVMGADWKKRMAWPDERAAVSAPREVVRDDDPPPPERAVVSRAAYDEPPPLPHDYPSLVGGARSASDLAVDDDSADADPAVSG
ncbi:MAG TPA: hypothetical protein VHN39_07035 [Phenylobacterium sp.]|nr:hypothetical protein [Phenylobacterium sp.]